MKEIDKHITEIKSYPIGHIICCGLDKSNNPTYYELSTDNAPHVFEYHYGYKFKTNRVKKLVFKLSVVHADCKIATEIRDRINTVLENGVLVLKPELLIAFENHLIKDVVFLSRNQLPWELLKRSVEDGFTIYMMNMDDIRNVEIVEKYGEIIGLMHYEFDLQSLKKERLLKFIYYQSQFKIDINEYINRAPTGDRTQIYGFVDHYSSIEL